MAGAQTGWGLGYRRDWTGRQWLYITVLYGERQKEASTSLTRRGDRINWAFSQDLSHHSVEKHWWQEWLPLVHSQKAIAGGPPEKYWPLRVKTDARDCSVGRQTGFSTGLDVRADVQEAWRNDSQFPHVACFNSLVLRFIIDYCLCFLGTYCFSLFRFLLDPEGKRSYYFKTSNAQSPSALFNQTPQICFQYITFPLICL